jgi:predicted DCC family thiol-disulfide oxidoreductase YuxK
LLFALGWCRRLLALLLWYGWACLLNRNVLIANPSIPFVGWLLLACAILPAGEPLALGTRRGGAGGFPWSMPKVLYWGAWFLMAAGYTVSGLHKLQSPSWVDGSALLQVLGNPLARASGLREWLMNLPPLWLQTATWLALGLEIGFLPLSLLPAARRWIWLLAIFFHLGILSMVRFSDLTLGMLMIHLFTFDARWVGAPRGAQAPVLFFDGVCGLCNGFVDFVLREDAGRNLTFAPLQGSTARRMLEGADRTNMDSVVLVAGGRTWRRSEAVLQVLSRLGGLWRVLAAAARLLPESLRDVLYGWVARHRYGWFGKRDVCRRSTPEERAFLLD